MNILIDMNLSPDWVGILNQSGYHAVHWSTVGSSGAPDSEIMLWAAEHGHIVLTHDLDFGALLAAARAAKPSVIQIRTSDVSPSHLKPLLLQALNRFEAELQAGALIVVDESRLRARILPIR